MTKAAESKKAAETKLTKNEKKALELQARAEHEIGKAREKLQREAVRKME